MAAALLLLAVLTQLSREATSATTRCSGYRIIEQGIAVAPGLGHLTNVSSPDLCCAACTKKEGCQAWTWHPEHSGGMSQFCWLMAMPGEPHGVAGSVTSGISKSLKPPPPPPPLPPPPPPMPPPKPPTRAPPLGFRPHVVFVMTDDQDMAQHSMLAMPKTRSHFGLDAQPSPGDGCAGGGACFNLSRGYVATPICCPSRASYLSGKYIHNHGTIQNNPHMGCSDLHWREEAEPRAYAAFMSAANYTSGFYGKYLNSYGDGQYGGGNLSHVPAGWNEWCALQGNSRFYDYKLSVNGVTEAHGSDYHEDYLTDLLANRSSAFIRCSLSAQADPSCNRNSQCDRTPKACTDAPGHTFCPNDPHAGQCQEPPVKSCPPCQPTRRPPLPGQPVLAVVHTPAPHRPAQPAPKYMDTFTNLTAPRTPAWNVISKDKHKFLSGLSPMDAVTVTYSDHIWRRRLRSLQSVDDLVDGLFAAVRDGGALNSTVFLYSSDHGCE
eukprot:COSAG05_NODE_181_length_14767_cov_9.554859_4_plen_492_part_00